MDIERPVENPHHSPLVNTIQTSTKEIRSLNRPVTEKDRKFVLLFVEVVNISRVAFRQAGLRPR